jgi:uncharacterized protein (DUF1800 family)
VQNKAARLRIAQLNKVLHRSDNQANNLVDRLVQHFLSELPSAKAGVWRVAAAAADGS